MTETAKARPDRLARGSRRASRSLCIQGIYQWLLAAGDAGVIDAFLREQEAYERCDREYLDRILHGTLVRAEILRSHFAPHCDRPLPELSPVEHAILLLATYELLEVPEVPYRVVINEAIELAKSFGGTDGHRYINGVLDKLAGQLRPHG